MNIEAQVIGVPTGVQDYRPALYGGVSAVELGVDRRPARGPRRRRSTSSSRRIVARLHRRVAQLGHQQLGRDGAADQRRRGGHRRRSTRIRDAALACARALERRDWAGVARQLAAEWTHRKRLAPGVTTPRDRRAASSARAARARSPARSAARAAAAASSASSIRIGKAAVARGARRRRRARCCRVTDRARRTRAIVRAGADHGSRSTKSSSSTTTRRRRRFSATSRARSSC